MKINPHASKLPAKIDLANGKGVDKARKPPIGDGLSPTPQASREPQTTIATARLIDRAFRAVQQTPVVDVQRVEAIRSRVVSGDYRIDDARVAEKLIEHERALGA